MKTGQKLTLAFSLCLILATVIGATAIIRMSQMNSIAGTLNSDTVEGFELLQKITDDARQYRTMELRHVLEPDAAAMQTIEGQMSSKADEVSKDLDDYDKSASGDEDRGNLSELKKRWETYLTFHNGLLALSHKDDYKGCHNYVEGDMSKSFHAVEDQIGVMSDWNKKHGMQLSNDAEAAFGSARLSIITLLSAAILIGIFMAYTVTKIIVGNLALVTGRLESLSGYCLADLGKAVDALAHGDLTVSAEMKTQPLDVKSTDEFGALAGTLNTMIARTKSTLGSFEQAQTALSQLIAQARNTAENINISAEEVSAGNQDLSQRTEEQASSLEETAASMEEMTSTVKQNADNSRQANQLAAHARELAEKGGTVVSDAVSAMGEINQGSKKISEIISVIDEIAFQTNLLALNASVEAARVGEQGRGFAVVAAEVRNLAGRSATAAKEIKSLVNDTVQKVQDGSDLVNQSGTQLNEIVAAVKKVADIISEISAASIEQSAGIEQVNKAVMQMDQMTQQNAALVEEAAGTSASMAQLAKDLQQVVAKFKLDQGYSQAMPQMAKPVQRAAATGTYGGGARGGKRPVTKPSAKLHLVSHQSDVDVAGHNADRAAADEFEEF
jgi:methyl-accepting chemotaxis protein